MSDLLKEYQDNRKKLQDIVKDLEEMANTAKSIIPKNLDFKSKFIVAERLDIATRLYDTVLKYRSEIAKQIKEELVIREKEEAEDDPITWVNSVSKQNESDKVL